MTSDAQIRHLARKVAAIEKQQLAAKQPSLSFSTIDDGAITAIDSDGNLTMVIGGQYDGTNTAAVITGPTPPQPLAPLLTPQPGALQIYWDGTFSDPGVVAPMDFARVLVYALPLVEYSAPDPLNQAIVVGQLTSATGGEVSAVLDPEIEYGVYLVAWSQAGKYGPASTVSVATTLASGQGVAGPPGADGTSLYTWLKYADDAVGTGMADDPTGKPYIGLAYNKATAAESTVATDYTWSLIKGADGTQGVPGPPGADGQPTYTWIKYGTDANGAGLNDSPTGMSYIGLAHNKTTATESTVATDYTWSLIQGPQGDPGATGPQGATGSTGPQGVSITSVTPYWQYVAAGAALPAKPTTAVPPDPWVAAEPAYASGKDLCRTERIDLSNNTFVYTNVVKVAAFEGANYAVTTADGKSTVTHSAAGPGTATNKVGDIWYQHADTALNRVIRQYRGAGGTTWTEVAFDRAIIPQIDIGAGTFGTLGGARLAADAIDGKTITGSTMQTAASGRRIVIQAGAESGTIDFHTASPRQSTAYPGGVYSDDYFVDASKEDLLLVLAGPAFEADSGKNSSVLQLWTQHDSTAGTYKTNARIQAGYIHLNAPGGVVDVTGSGGLNVSARVTAASLDVGGGQVVNGIDFGMFSGGTDANARMVVPHDLGVVPSTVIVTGGSTQPRAYYVFAKTSTDFTVQVRTITDGSNVVNNTSVDVAWFALA